MSPLYIFLVLALFTLHITNGLVMPRMVQQPSPTTNQPVVHIDDDDYPRVASIFKKYATNSMQSRAMLSPTVIFPSVSGIVTPSEKLRTNLIIKALSRHHQHTILMEEAARLLEQEQTNNLLPLDSEGLIKKIAHQTKPALPFTSTDHKDHEYSSTTSHDDNMKNDNHFASSSSSSKPKSYIHLLGLKYDGKSFLLKMRCKYSSQVVQVGPIPAPSSSPSSSSPSSSYSTISISGRNPHNDPRIVPQHRLPSYQPRVYQQVSQIRTTQQQSALTTTAQHKSQTISPTVQSVPDQPGTLQISANLPLGGLGNNEELTIDKIEELLQEQRIELEDQIRALIANGDDLDPVRVDNAIQDVVNEALEQLRATYTKMLHEQEERKQMLKKQFMATQQQQQQKPQPTKTTTATTTTAAKQQEQNQIPPATTIAPTIKNVEEKGKTSTSTKPTNDNNINNDNNKASIDPTKIDNSNNNNNNNNNNINEKAEKIQNPQQDQQNQDISIESTTTTPSADTKQGKTDELFRTLFETIENMNTDEVNNEELQQLLNDLLQGEEIEVVVQNQDDENNNDDMD